MHECTVGLNRQASAFKVTGPYVDTISFGYMALGKDGAADIPPTRLALDQLHDWAQQYNVELLIERPVYEHIKHRDVRGFVAQTATVPTDERLYPHQHQAVQTILGWAATNNGQIRMLIADDPRLGKSIEALTAIRFAHGHGPVLILCPKALIEQWVEYCKQWLCVNADEIMVLSGPMVKRYMQLDGHNKLHPVVITNWEALNNQQLFLRIRHINWFAIVGDEAHKLKNRQSQLSQRMSALSTTTKHLLLLSATFVEHYPDEWWSPLHIIKPNEFSSFWRWVGHYVEQRKNFWGFVDFIKPKHTNIMRDHLQPYVIQRKASDIVDMPEQIFETVYCQLDNKHQAWYKQIERQIVIELTNERLTIPNRAARIVRLRQASIHPLLLDVATTEFDLLTGKLELLVELINNLPTGEQAIVFCNFVTGCDLAADVINQKILGRAGVFAGPQADSAVIEQFKAGTFDILITTPGKGGVGLNLYNANYIYYLDTPWSTIDLRQSQDRTIAIGKRDPVYIAKLVARDTIDEHVERIINVKLQHVTESAATNDVINYLIKKGEDAYD